MGSTVSATASMRTQPTSRGLCSDKRLKHRDSWNTSEIKIQELFAAHDQNGSGFLEQDEFREVLREFNDGWLPSDQEVTLILRLADLNRDGSISQAELHYALRAWHTYKNLSGEVLRLISEFDSDESGRLDFQQLKDLLTSLNGGVSVSLPEVQWVHDIGDVNGDGRLDRSELMGAVAAWYVHVDRRQSDLTDLMREAVARTANDSDHGQALRLGSRHLSQAFGLVRRAFGGYSEVNSSPADAESGGVSRGSTDAPWRQGWSGAPRAARPSSQAASSVGAPAGEPDPAAESRTQKLLCMIAVAMGKMCYAFVPFLFGGLLVSIGWHTRDNICPRNLDGVQLWFGALAIALGATAYLDGPVWARDLKVSLVVMLVMLNILGLAWAFDGRVSLYRDTCGPKLVVWSRCLWPAVPIFTVGIGAHRCVTYLRHLRHHDQQLQKDSPA